jgi:ketosteroid isomerase-like protein
MTVTLQQLSDRAEIADVLARYCERVDEYDLDGVAATFTLDCFTDYGAGRGGPTVGRAAVRERIAQGQAQFRRTHHQLGQSLIHLDGDTAAGITYVTAWHEDWDGSRPVVRLRYVDELVRAPEGWLLSSRRVHAAGIEGRLEDIAWDWVDRALPAGH